MNAAADSRAERRARPLRMLALEPYYGGSHRTVLDGLLARLELDVDLLTLPARKWKWRMRGAAITMAATARALHADRTTRADRDEGTPGAAWDLVYASTFVNLAEFYGLAGEAVAGVPSVVYFHENQLVYPNRHEAEWDFQFPLTNITSALTADACLFNTRFTLDSFVDNVEPFLKRFPDHRPTGVAEQIRAKSSVVPPPFDPSPFDRALARGGPGGAPRGPHPLIVWPHRWEHDKDPDTFFRAVERLTAEGLTFDVAVAGQAFQDVPPSIRRARDTLGERLVHVGEPETRDDYAALLARADIAVSTAVNEFFGLAMLESAYAGCWPLVPDRLAYPELYPERFRYRDEEHLVAQLRSLVQNRPVPGEARGIAERFTFDRLTDTYRDSLREAARMERGVLR